LLRKYTLELNYGTGFYDYDYELCPFSPVSIDRRTLNRVVSTQNNSDAEVKFLGRTELKA